MGSPCVMYGNREGARKMQREATGVIIVDSVYKKKPRLCFL